jgi:hypothetical protein
LLILVFQELEIIFWTVGFSRHLPKLVTGYWFGFFSDTGLIDVHQPTSDTNVAV